MMRLVQKVKSQQGMSRAIALSTPPLFAMSLSCKFFLKFTLIKWQ